MQTEPGNMDNTTFDDVFSKIYSHAVKPSGCYEEVYDYNIASAVVEHLSNLSGEEAIRSKAEAQTVGTHLIMIL